jgi:signal recognition particle subunit SRP54
MFNTLTDKLTTVFNRLNNRGRLSEKEVEEVLREIRLAFLEADVNFRVAKELIESIRERATGTAVLESLSPGQQVIKIVNEELTTILGRGRHELQHSPEPPSVLLLVGLQGSGKTTTSAKLALQLRRQGQSSLLVGADLRRPAALEQLIALGKQLDVPVYPSQPIALEELPTMPTVVERANAGVARARELGLRWAIIDTSGRLHIDNELMRELEELKDTLEPTESILVVDSMTGQDAVNAAEAFHQRIGLTGLILTKLDGDTRGGAALSIAHVTGVPVKYIGTGEKPDALEPFYPDRLASRILGMGDVLTLIERAKEHVEEKQAKEMEQKIRQATFNLEDFLKQLQQIKRIGSVGQILEMIPGISSLARKIPTESTDETRLKKVEAIIFSMTLRERRNPDIINGNRRRRIAKGSGTLPQDINQLLNQFKQMRKLMKQMASGRIPKGLGGLFG